MSNQFIILSLLLLFPLTAFATDEKITPLDVKLGLWQSTTTMKLTGLEGLLADVPQEMRAMVKAQMQKQMQKTETDQDCITQEELESISAFDLDDESDCNKEVIESTKNHLKLKIKCKGETDMSGMLDYQALSDKHVKGKMTGNTSANGKQIKMNIDFESKYLGPDCKGID